MTDLDKLIASVEAGECPHPSTFRLLFDYAPDTGLLYWKPRTPEMFRETDKKTPQRQCNWWNSRYAGKQAFTAKKDSGYYGGPFFGKNVMAHRVVWGLHYGEWPLEDIDHINGDRWDNRISNLRLVNDAINAMNRRANSGKRSGLPHGVSMKGNGRYFAQIQKSGINHHLGYFATAEEAHAAYTAAAERFGFHPNHGLRALKAKGDA